MQTYKVKPGFTHGKNKQYGPGDTVELTVEEAAGFLDKLELASGKQAKSTSNSESTDLRATIQGATDAELADALGVDVKALTALRQGKSAPMVKEGGLIVNPAPLPAENVEQQLEEEVGGDVEKTSDNPPTFVETDKPAPTGVPKNKSRFDR